MSVAAAAIEGASRVEAPETTSQAKSTEEKMATASEPKKVADHPKYASMIQDGLSALKERGGSSRQALLKYIIKHYNLGQDEKVINAHLKLAIRAGVKTGTLKQSKGVGASGSFKLGTEKEHPKEAKTTKKPTKAVVKKVKAATPKKVKKPKNATEAAKPKKPKSSAKATKTAKPKAATKNSKPVAAKVKKPKKATPAKAKKTKVATKAAKPKKAAARK